MVDKKPDYESIKVFWEQASTDGRHSDYWGLGIGSVGYASLDDHKFEDL